MGIRSRQVAIAVSLILVAVGFIMYTGIQETSVYYYTVSEVVEQQSQLIGEPLRIAGEVVPGSINQDNTGLIHEFMIEEGGKMIPVVYRDIAPDTFQDRAEAVVEGTLDEHGTFQATFLMAKCPSKYEAATEYEEYRTQGVSAPAQGR